MSSPAFKVIAENEFDIIRIAGCKHGGAAWNIKSTKCGLVISRDDDCTSIDLRVPLELVATFMREMAEQHAALKDGTGDLSLVWGGPAA